MELEQSIHTILNEAGAYQFYRALSQVCMNRSQEVTDPPINTTQRQAWLWLSARAAAAMNMAERTQEG